MSPVSADHPDHGPDDGRPAAERNTGALLFAASAALIDAADAANRRASDTLHAPSATAADARIVSVDITWAVRAALGGRPGEPV